jgi:biopolymer transport protein ExbB
MLACAGLGLVITLDRLYRLRRGRVIPGSFQNRFRDRLSEGALDRAKAADYCELNPSPASRVALAAIRRWGRTAVELERAFTLERQREGARLMRGIATLRRIAGLSPLLGLLGTLAAAQRGLAGLGTESAVSWGPIVAVALGPLTFGLALAIIATVAYDACSARAEDLLCELDRLGAEVVDAIVTYTPRESTRAEYRAEPGTPTRAPHVSYSTAKEPHGRAGRRRDRGAGDVRGT